MTACRVCEAKTEAFICNRCGRQLEHALAEMPALLRDLDVTISRQDRGTGAALYAMKRSRVQLPGVHYDEGVTTLPETSWPFSWNASDLRWAVENTIVTWARHVAESRRTGVTGSPSAFLLSHIDAIRMDEAAAQAWDEITACQRDIQRAIDRQAPDLFVGRCDAPSVHVHHEDGQVLPEVSTCGADLYARTGDDDVRCPSCAAVYDVARQMRQMRALLPDQLAPVRQVADGLTKLGEPVTVDRIDGWIRRGMIEDRGRDGNGHRLVRVGDVQALLERREKAS